MISWKDNFEKLRRWIDSDSPDLIPDKIEQAQKIKSESEIFLQKLLNSIEELLKKEITRIPNTSKAYVPKKFTVFISNDANNNLPDEKRKFFEQGLSSIIFERAKELAGTLELTSKNITVEMKVNATLEDDAIDVIAFSGDKSETIENFSTPIATPILNKVIETIVDDQTIIDSQTIEDFETVLGVFYRAEIWQNGKKINEVPIIRRKILIGRDTGDNLANLKLPTDNRKISRIHAEIDFEPSGNIWVTAKHKNPTIVSGHIIKNEEKAKLELSEDIRIYDFLIKIKRV